MVFGNMQTQRAIVPLADEARPVVDTEAVAHYLNLKPQSLRNLAAQGKAPIQPLKICGRLRWPTDAVRQLLGMPRISRSDIVAYSAGYFDGLRKADPAHPLVNGEPSGTAATGIVLTDENPDDYEGERWIAREGVVASPPPHEPYPDEGGAA